MRDKEKRTQGFVCCCNDLDWLICSKGTRKQGFVCCGNLDVFIYIGLAGCGIRESV